MMIKGKLCICWEQFSFPKRQKHIMKELSLKTLASMLLALNRVPSRVIVNKPTTERCEACEWKTKWKFCSRQLFPNAKFISVFISILNDFAEMRTRRKFHALNHKNFSMKIHLNVFLWRFFFSGKLFSWFFFFLVIFRTLFTILFIVIAGGNSTISSLHMWI